MTLRWTVAEWVGQEHNEREKTTSRRNDAKMLNRSVLIVRPNQPYLDWAASLDDSTPVLKRGGAESPSNMQWQTKEAAKIKDRTE